MSKEKHQNPLPRWKPFVFGLATPIFVKLLHLWLSDPIGWGIGVFVLFVLFYETPPKFGPPPNFLKTLFWSAAGGLVAFTFAKLPLF
ncbi:MAG: hypothetical protein ACR2HX_01480 [Pyrinomonadaceae bacterium]